MSKEAERRREVVVGVFVLAALGAAAVMIIALGSQQNLFERRFRARAIFGQVSGLRAGAPVFVAGVNVGAVDSLRFVSAAAVPTPAPTGPGGSPEPGRGAAQVGKVEVLMSIEERFRNQIRADSVATIDSVGLLGDKCIEISVGSSSEPVISRNDVLRSSDPLTLTDVVDQLEPIRAKLDKILGDIAAVTDTLTTEDRPISRSLQSVSNILAKIDAGQGTFGELVNSPEMGRDLDAAIKNVDGFVTQARAVVAKIEQATVELPPTMVAMRRFADDVATLSFELEKSAQQLPGIVDDVRVVAQNLRLASQSLPSLAAETEQGVREATEVFDAAGKTIFLRGYVDQTVQRMPAALERSAGWEGPAPDGTAGDAR